MYYTPEHVAGLMAESSIARFDRNDVTILDPACGEGALLSAVLMNLIRSSSGTARLDLIRDRLFGVDIDPSAVAQTKRRLFELIDPPVAHAAELQRILDSQIVCGNSLTGSDFVETDSIEALNDDLTPRIDWKFTFPQIARQGGFDLIIANPPYRRERNSKPIFDRLLKSSLGRKWRTARMDLWHYFFHRSLDLLKPGGRLCFLVNSYWTKSPGARPLIRRIQQETTLEEIVEFDTLAIFDDVGGRHMILQLQNGVDDRKCKITRMIAKDDRLQEQNSVWLTSHDMFRGEQLILQSNIPLEHAANGRLGDHFLVRQGIAENPPTINAKIARNDPGRYRRGDGVFVLTSAEVAALEFSDDERQLLRPYALPAELQRYRLPASPTRYLLYLTPKTVPDLSRYPHIERHLQRFRPLMEQRREVRKGTIAWWHLHWPRDEQLFIQPRILHVQMGRRPTFVYAEQPLFVGFSINVVATDVTRSNDRRLRTNSDDDSPLPLPALTAILNSARAESWFEAFAKHRGVRLEISGTLLRQFPLPRREPAAIEWLNEMSIRYHADLKNRQEEENDAEYERKIDSFVAALYGEC